MVLMNTSTGKHWHLGYCAKVAPCLRSTEATQHRRRLGEWLVTCHKSYLLKASKCKLFDMSKQQFLKKDYLLSSHKWKISDHKTTSYLLHSQIRKLSR